MPGLRSRGVIIAAALGAALLVGGTGGAVAGSLVTGADIEDGTVTGTDVEDGSLSAADLAPGAAGRSAPGAAGSASRGLWAASGAYPDNGATLDVAITLPRPASRPLQQSDIIIAVGDGAAACRGTLARPTAPRGKVCVYGATNDSVSSVYGYVDRGSRLGFRLSVQGTGRYRNVTIDGSWAYTPR